MSQLAVSVSECPKLGKHVHGKGVSQALVRDLALD
jgi:hypothetical protein